MPLLRSLRRFFSRHIYGLGAIFLPRVCCLCGRHLLPEERCVCRPCLDGLPATQFERFRGNSVEERMFGRITLRSAFACYYFRHGEALRELIHGFKYHSNKELARELGREMARRAMSAGFLSEYEVIVPVPLHEKKRRIRGYNQSQLIAEGMSQVSGIPVVSDALLRTVFASTQTALSADQRFLNVKDDFALGPGAPRLAGKAVLLVDDVFTTGATSEACLIPLLTIEGVSVGVATLAYAQG